MNSTRLLKEARQLFWPWSLVTAIGAASLTRFSVAGFTLPWNWAELIVWFGAFLGVPLLATLPVSADFQYRTFALSLAQPVSRHEIWRLKFIVTGVAVLPLAVLYCISARLNWRDGDLFWVETAILMVILTAGAIFWTLIARSTIGGLALNYCLVGVIEMGWFYLADHLGFVGRHSRVSPAYLWGTLALTPLYAAVMIWLGRRRLLRFQAVEGMQSDEAVIPGAPLVPRFIADWFRCRPTQPLANLVRREFHLLRALWPLSLLYLGAWIFLVAFRQMPTNQPETRYVAFGLTIILGVLIAILAGTLSLGEEKTWGTHQWHMTVPVSTSLQWGVKLLFASGTSLVCVAILPICVLLLGGWAGRVPASFLSGNIAMGWMAEAVGITLLAFWCACVVRGTVQATIWVFPLGFAMGLARQCGSWALGQFANPLEKLLATIISWLDAIAVERAVSRTFAVISPEKVLALAVLPLLAVGLIQSRRLFRAQVGANRLRVARCALPLFIVAFLCGLTGDVLAGVLRESWRQQSTILRETDFAIAALQAADPRLNPRRLSLEDLAHAAPLSEGTRRWLRQASITVAPAPDRLAAAPGSYFPGRILLVVQNSQLKGRLPYSAVVRAANGTECSMTFQVQKQGRVGFVTAVCQ